MAPYRRRITERGEGHVVEEIKGILLVQELDRGAGPFLPENIVKPKADGIFSKLLEPFWQIIINEPGFRLRSFQGLQCLLNARAVLGLSQHSDIVETGHLQRPLPADFRLRTLLGFTGEGGEQNSQAT